MPRRDKRAAPSLSAPNWDDHTGWALWCLSLVLREIAEDQVAEAAGGGSALDSQSPAVDAEADGGPARREEEHCV